MAKSKDTKKEVKKEPVKTAKEKKEEKREKKYNSITRGRLIPNKTSAIFLKSGYMV